MADDLSACGVCSVVRCDACHLTGAGACPGCRGRDAKTRQNGGKRCAIIVCSEARGRDSCFDCDDFPCSVFISPSSLYLPRETSDPSIGCSTAVIPRDPTRTSKKFISRLATYLTVAEHRRRLGNETVTSSEFASAAGIKPQLVRKDLLSLGHFGIPHVGFKLDVCIEALRKTMNLKTIRNVVWVGLNGAYRPEQFMGRMESQGCRIVAVLNTSEGSPPKTVNTGRIRVFDFTQVGRVVKNLAVVGAIIACDNTEVQTAADTLTQLGITSMLNLTPVPIDHPPRVFVKNIDLSEDIMLFSFYCKDHEAASKTSPES